MMSLAFTHICELLDSIEKIQSRQPRPAQAQETRSVEKFVSQWCATHRRVLDSPNLDGGAVLSIIFPHRRKDRVYGLQARSLAKKIPSLIGFSDYQTALLNCWTDHMHGDLGSCTEQALKSRRWDHTDRKSPTVEHVNHFLTQLASRYWFSDPSIQRQRDQSFSTDTALKQLFYRLKSFEAKWLIRLILREFSTIILDEASVLKQIHFLLPDLLTFQNDFEAAFRLLKGPLQGFPSAPTPIEERQLRLEATQHLTPTVGIKVGRPEFRKAWSFKHLFQMLGNRAWAAEHKYDGEYCEIHVDLVNSKDPIQIFSKNGKDATADRRGLHETIYEALRIRDPNCVFSKNCILLGELVVYCDKQQKILPFSKIRKHVSRTGSFIGTLQDSLPHDWEHLMIVFFDVLLVDDTPILTNGLQARRQVLRQLVHCKKGRAMRSEWTLVDCKTSDGVTDLKQTVARAWAMRQEGLVLKPLHASYFPLHSTLGIRQPGYFIKLKRDYLGDLGGQRDLGDFAIVGASYDAHVASKTDIRPLHWTHFHLGCMTNKTVVLCHGIKPVFKVVAVVSLDKAIPKAELKHLNTRGPIRSVDIQHSGRVQFDIAKSRNGLPQIQVAFKEPFVAEVLGGGFEQAQNEKFEMLRHPRIKKIHHDRTWKDTVCIEELGEMAKEKWSIPDAEELEGHAKDVALLAEKYVQSWSCSQSTVTSAAETSQEATQTTSRSSQETPRELSCVMQNEEEWVVQETQEVSCTPTLDIQFRSRTPGLGVRGSRETRILVREDTAERFQPPAPPANAPMHSTHSPTTRPNLSSNHSPSKKRRSSRCTVSPPSMKRRKTRAPLKNADNKRNLGTFDYDSQEKVINVYAEQGWTVKVHNSSG